MSIPGNSNSRSRSRSEYTEESYYSDQSLSEDKEDTRGSASGSLIEEEISARGSYSVDNSRQSYSSQSEDYSRRTPSSSLRSDARSDSGPRPRPGSESQTSRSTYRSRSSSQPESKSLSRSSTSWEVWRSRSRPRSRPSQSSYDSDSRTRSTDEKSLSWTSGAERVSLSNVAGKAPNDPSRKSRSSSSYQDDSFYSSSIRSASDGAFPASSHSKTNASSGSFRSSTTKSRSSKLNNWPSQSSSDEDENGTWSKNGSTVSGESSSQSNSTRQAHESTDRHKNFTLQPTSKSAYCSKATRAPSSRSRDSSKKISDKNSDASSNTSKQSSTIVKTETTARDKNTAYLKPNSSRSSNFPFASTSSSHNDIRGNIYNSSHPSHTSQHDRGPAIHASFFDDPVPMEAGDASTFPDETLDDETGKLSTLAGSFPTVSGDHVATIAVAKDPATSRARHVHEPSSTSIKKETSHTAASAENSSKRQAGEYRSTHDNLLQANPDFPIGSSSHAGSQSTTSRHHPSGIGNAETMSPRFMLPTRNQSEFSSCDSAHSSPIHSGSSAITMESVVNIQRCKSIAILGTMSDAGKSIITAGLCRLLANHGTKVAPFKGQNMSNNAAPALLPEKKRQIKLYKTFQMVVGGKLPEPLEKDLVVETGYGEIGTAQSLQAEACRLVPRVEMNPVLLKSGGQNEKGEYMCSVLVLGKQVARETYGDLGRRTTDLRTMVLESHEALAEATDCEVILMEGAGSCTELNLMERDIVNLPLVRALQCPWFLVANIDCGGVFAQIVGTKMCVSKRDWSLCAGIIINKLRGEAKFFEPGPKMIEDMVDKPVFVVPFLPDLHLPEEDGVGIERRLQWELSGHYHPTESHSEEEEMKPNVVIIAYPHTAISNDICPLEGDSRFRVEWRRRLVPRPYPHTTSVILPGSRLTRKDLKWLHDSGWAAFLKKHVTAGGIVLGLCGGYQMLGWTVDDPHKIEGSAGSRQGLGLLPIRTRISPPEVKVVAPRLGRLYASGQPVKGFELHCGYTQIVTDLGEDLSEQIRPLVTFDDGRQEGLCANRVRGTYLHGILWSPEARAELLVADKDQFPIFDQKPVDPLDRLAAHLESCGLDFKMLQSVIASHRNW